MGKKINEFKETVENETIIKETKTITAEETKDKQLTAEEKLILEDAKKYGVVPSSQMTVEQIIYEFERVPFQAFADGDKYKDDLHIRMNGRNIIIQRGVPVNIPRCVKNIIDKSQKQKASANQKMAEYIRAYSNNEKQLSY